MRMSGGSNMFAPQVDLEQAALRGQGSDRTELVPLAASACEQPLLLIQIQLAAIAGMDDGNNLDRLQRGARNKNALRVRPHVRWSELDALRLQKRKIVARQTFQLVAVAHSHTNPQAGRPRTGSKISPHQPLWIGAVAAGKLPHEAHHFYLLQRHGEHFTCAVEQFQTAIVREALRVDVARVPLAAELSHDHFLST